MNELSVSATVRDSGKFPVSNDISGRLLVDSAAEENEVCMAMLKAVLEVPACGVCGDVECDIRRCLYENKWTSVSNNQESTATDIQVEQESSHGSVLVSLGRLVVPEYGVRLALPIPCVTITTKSGFAMKIFATKRHKIGDQALFYPQYAFMCNNDIVKNIDEQAFDNKNLVVFMPAGVSHREKRIQNKCDHRKVLSRLCLTAQGKHSDVILSRNGVIVCSTEIDNARIVTCHVPSY